MIRNPLSRITFLFLAVFVVCGLISVRLFYLQVLAHPYYKEVAEREQQGYTTLPSRRGEILIEDKQSGDIYKLGTNTTLDMIYADPTLIDDPDHVAEVLAPLLFDLELEQELDQQRIEDALFALNEITDPILLEQAEKAISPKSDEELFDQYKSNLESTFSQKTRDVILVAEELDLEAIEEIRALNLEGVELSENGNLYAYPAKISNESATARALADVFNTDSGDLERILLGKNRYVVLKRKLEPNISDQIETILTEDRQAEDPKFLGIRLKEEYFRFYPEGSLGAQVIGYTNSAGEGQYGIEGSFDEILRGTDGIFTSQIDAYGKQITVGTSIIEQAQDGADITLTIDRAIQLQVDRFLAKGVQDYQADSGQAIVINPKTGEILAMAQYPTFNPNSYGDVFDKYKIELTEDQKNNLYVTGTEEEPHYWLYIQKDPDVRIELFPDEENPGEYVTYENKVGPEVYKNKTIQEVFEPGSVFKPLVMSAAMDAGELTPNTTFVDSGPIQVDEYEIHTFNDTYHGIETMTQVLEHSCNTGMAFVALELQRTLFYNYLEDFGFTERTGIELEDEVMGKLEHFDLWADSELVTKAFGQGITITPLQLVQAYTALANGGVMMQPQIVKKIEYADGRVETFDPEIVRRVISKETAEQITAMLVSTSESYHHLVNEQHFFAAKSGTAQTYKWGKALSGRGTTIASFIGFAPIDDPQFLVLVKMDHPRTCEWADCTSGYVFENIFNFLFDYYNVPPDK